MQRAAYGIPGIFLLGSRVNRCTGRPQTLTTFRYAGSVTVGAT